jgi:uncharacterized protein YaaR (DUF327 family)
MIPNQETKQHKAKRQKKRREKKSREKKRRETFYQYQNNHSCTQISSGTRNLLSQSKSEHDKSSGSKLKYLSEITRCKRTCSAFLQIIIPNVFLWSV